jgi:hypothetical protein
MIGKDSEAHWLFHSDQLLTYSCLNWFRIFLEGVNRITPLPLMDYTPKPSKTFRLRSRNSNSEDETNIIGIVAINMHSGVSLPRNLLLSLEIPRPSKTSITDISKTRSSAYHKNFERYIINEKVFPEGYEYPNGRRTPEPNNEDELEESLVTSRPSLSPSRFTVEDFRRFKRDNSWVYDGSVMSTVFPTIRLMSWTRRSRSSNQ